MIDPKRAGVSDDEWAEATAHCHPLRVASIIDETHDARSLILEIPDALRETFSYKAGQFLSFKIPFEGRVLVRSYSLSSSPDCDPEHKVTVKRVDEGRVSNLMNETVGLGTTLMVVPPAGFFVLGESERKIVLFSGGSGITPVISIIKSGLATTGREMKLVYANRDARSIIFREELDALVAKHPGRLEIVHSLDDTDGFVDRDAVVRHAAGDREADFYLCGPAVFMDIVEGALLSLQVPPSQIHIERFESPPDPEADRPAEAVGASTGDSDGTPDAITVVIDGASHEVPYQEGERVLHAARRAGLDPPFSCEEGYCSCCMAKLVDGRVEMAANDCLSADLLEEGWVLTCQSRCISRKIRIEYPD